MTVTADAYTVVTQRLAEVTEWRPKGETGDWLCPAHDDSNPSLSVRRGNKGVVLKCHRNCETADVLKALSLKAADLFDEPKTTGNGQRSRIAATYDYVDEADELLFQVVRKEPKTFLQRRPSGGGWEWSLGDTRRVIYRLPRVLEAVARGDVVYVVEGEKDVHAVEAAGATATCNPMGAGKWDEAFSAWLSGARVVVVADRDSEGRKHARDVAASLERAGASVVLAEPAIGKDAADHLGAGKGLDEFVEPEPNGDTTSPSPAEGDRGEQAEVDEKRDLRLLAVRAAAPRALVDGATFLRLSSDAPLPVWGNDDGVAWSMGEYCLLCGPTAIGKSTMVQGVIKARMGVVETFLGMAVVPDDRPVLYLALDRPPQIARSMARIFGDVPDDELAARLQVWRRPLPLSILKDREILGAMAADVGAGTIVVDSLKDLAPKLSDDETGQAVKEALSLPCLEGIEVFGLHHQRKKQQGGGKPKTLDDVYGAVWLAAGAGSVLLAWGEPGDAVIELSHLKPPADPVGPLTVLHDFGAGTMTVEGEVDLLDVVRTSKGLNAEGAARALFHVEQPDRNQVEKARRRLNKLVDKGVVHADTSGRSQLDGRQLPTRYYLVERRP